MQEINDFNKIASGMMSDDEVEQAFMMQATRFVEDKAKPIHKPPFYLGFEIVYKNDANNKMIGIFAYRINKGLFYAPAFFLNGEIKGTDLFYVVKEKMFVPLDDEWVNYYINKYTRSQGTGITNQEASKMRRSVDLRWISLPPYMKTSSIDSNRYEEQLRQDKADFDTISREAKRSLLTIDFEKKASGLTGNLKDMLSKDRRFLSKIASTIKDDAHYEFLNNIHKCLGDTQWMPDHIEEPQKKVASVEDKLIVHLGRFNPNNPKIASKQQLFQGISLEDNRKEIIPVYIKDKCELNAVTHNGVWDILGDDNRFHKCFVFIGEPNWDMMFRDTDDRGRLNVRDWTNSKKRRNVYVVDLEDGGDLDYTEESGILRINENDTSKLNDFTNINTAKAYGYNLLDEKVKFIKPDDIEIGKKYLVIDPFAGRALFEYIRSIDEDNECYLINDFLTISKVEGAPSRNNASCTTMPFFGKDTVVLEVKPVSKKDSETCPDNKGYSEDASYNTTSYNTTWKPAKNRRMERVLLRSLGLDFAKLKYDNQKFFLEKNAHRSCDHNDFSAKITLMNDLKASEADVDSIMKIAKDKGECEFMYKLGAQSLVLDPVPAFTTDFDSTVNVPMEYPQSFVVNLREPGKMIPDPRLGDQYENSGTAELVNENKPEPEFLKEEVMNANQLAEFAKKTGERSIFEHGVIGSLASTYGAYNLVAEYIPDMRTGLDRVGRLIFLYYWRPEDFAEKYGAEDLTELESLLISSFKRFGDLVLALVNKSDDFKNELED